MPHYLFVLGAPDAEMRAIEDAISVSGHRLAYAGSASDGRWARVTSAGAYHSNFDFLPPEPEEVVVFVECLPRLLLGHTVLHVDHHRPGDPGFGQPPSRFWQASSLGQVMNLIQPGVDPSLRHLLLAASDHCPSAAYAGECPGVDPQELRAFRLAERAAWLAHGDTQGRAAPRAAIAAALGRPSLLTSRYQEEWEHAIQQAHELGAKTVLAAPTWCGYDRVADLLDQPQIPELLEILFVLGRAAAYSMVTPEGRKVGIIGGGQGSIPGEEPIRYFLDTWAKEQGIRNRYGDPVRGYAGGYT